MGRIINSYIFPHPPIIVPEVGRGGENGATLTVNAAKKASIDIRNEKPTTIIVTTPHGPIFQDYVFISLSERLSGSLARFGYSEVMSFDNNTGLAGRIIEISNSKGINSGDLDNRLIKKYGVSRELDHGALVPLYYITREYTGFRLVCISTANLPYHDLYRFGACISRAVEESGEQVVFIASGDMSHRLSHEAPYGYNKRGREFDELVVDCIRTSDIERLMRVDEEFCESAGECGLRSFIMMFGAIDRRDIKPEVYSYEGPFGVGYAIARFNTGGENPGRQILKNMEEKEIKQMSEIRNGEDPYVRLARTALEIYVKEGRIIRVPDGLLPEMLESRAGTFVSLKKYGQLRGCIGTTGPVRRNIAEEIIHNAISSGTQDPRFDPVEAEELDKLVYSVDVLSKSEPVKSKDELDVERYGVIVRCGMRSGLLLPNLEGVDDVDRQIAIALQKAGISQNERFEMERFEVVRHK